jgi:hypothetical protein
METTTTSKQFSLKLNDFWKGLIMAIGTPVIAIMLLALQAGSFNFDWKTIGTVAASALLTYLSKNFFTPSAIVVKDAPQAAVDAVNAGTSEVSVTPK